MKKTAKNLKPKQKTKMKTTQHFSVKELINELQKFPSDMPVALYGDEEYDSIKCLVVRPSTDWAGNTFLGTAIGQTPKEADASPVNVCVLTQEDYWD